MTGECQVNFTQRSRTGGPADPATRTAVADTLNFLSPQERGRFLDFPEAAGAASQASFLLADVPVRVLRFADWQVEGAPDSLAADVLPAAQRLLDLRRAGSQERMGLAGVALLMVHDVPEAPTSGLIAVIGPQAMAGFLARHYPAVRIPPALQRLLTCYLGGLSLKAAAEADGKSLETARSQTRELRRRMGVARIDDMTRNVAALLWATVARLLDGERPARHAGFDGFARRFLPPGVRRMVLLGEGGEVFRVLDMGPRTGRPVVALHAILLPDIRPQDLALLDRLDLRLIWPLRHGAHAPLDPPLSEEAQIRHACRGIDLVRELFCQGRADLLSFAASSKVALAYARDFPGRTGSLMLAVACVLEGRPDRGARRLARGLTALAGRSPRLMEAAMGFLARRALAPDRAARFLRHQFAASAADSAVVEAELAGPHGVARFAEGLGGSLASIRHDFGFQRALDWDLARDLNGLHILHGDGDAIHPLPLIEALVADLPGARLHVIPGAGQLMYRQHLEPLLARVGTILSARGG